MLVNLIIVTVIGNWFFYKPISDMVEKKKGGNEKWISLNQIVILCRSLACWGIKKMAQNKNCIVTNEIWLCSYEKYEKLCKVLTFHNRNRSDNIKEILISKNKSHKWIFTSVYRGITGRRTTNQSRDCLCPLNDGKKYCILTERTVLVGCRNVILRAVFFRKSSLHRCQ